MNNYETFKDELITELTDMDIPDEYVKEFLSVVDRIALSYNVEKQNVGLTVWNGIPSVVKMFIASKAVEQKSKETLKNYTMHLTHFFEWINKPVEKVSTNDIRVYFNEYQTQRHIKASTMETMRHVFMSFFTWCNDEDYIQKNPAKRLLAFKQEQTGIKYLTNLELEYIRGACKTLREKAVIDFLFSTGCRVTELCNVLINDVSITDQTVLIRNGKGKKQRTTFLNAEAIVSVKAYLDGRQYQSPYLFGNNRRDTEKPLGKKAIEAEIRHVVSRVRDKLSMDVTPHKLRHTAATTAIRNGMPIEQVREFLGHSNMNTTLRYAKIDSNDVKRSHEKYVR